ncbi:MAG: glycosyltransferase family 9 protein [Proteobacteria bacterium]|nr:glycosyltransferase family 9 protein [Pseudomonadota bacterium]
MRLLFVTSTRVGDAVLSTGILGHLLAEHPDARVSVACGPAAAALFAALPGLERVIVVEKRPLAGHWLRLWLACAPRLWDLVVDLRASALAYLVPARSRRVFRRAPPGVHRVRALAALLGLDADPPAPRVWLNGAHRAQAARLIPGDGPVIALGPTANWPAKVWPAERFADLFRRLSAAGGPVPGARAAVFGAPGEEWMAAPLVQALDPARRIDLVGRLDLLAAAACLARAALFVGNDSGLMHLAAATGAPTLGLFGPSRPEEYAPWGPRAAWVRTEASFEDLTGPGFDHRRTDSLMRSLGIETVEAAARALLAGTRGAAA